MSLARADMTGIDTQGRDIASWQDLIDTAISTADPIVANLRITAAHYELSRALHAVLGPDSGANFHTWATWGSKKAGQTIRQEEAPALGALACLAGGGLGMLVTALAPRRVQHVTRAAGALLGAWSLQAVAQRQRDRASRMVLGGNITVLDDIGRQTARFICFFQGYPEQDSRRLADFLRGLRPGPSAEGGQDLLKQAFTHYYQARHASCRAARHEHMLLGNLCAILHEHIRLQPYIAGAMPLPARRLITLYLLDFSLGERTMSVGKDVTPLHGIDRFQAIEQPDLRQFLASWDRTHDGVRGSRAGNWATIQDRMNFICALFRTGHCDQGLFSAPYTGTQCAEIEAGRVPAGAL